MAGIAEYTTTRQDLIDQINTTGWRDGEGNWIEYGPEYESNREQARKTLALYDQLGVDSSDQIPLDVKTQSGLFESNSPKTFGGQVKDFITNPGVLLAAGGLGAMYAAPAAGAGADTAWGANAAGSTVAGDAGVTVGTGAGGSAAASPTVLGTATGGGAFVGAGGAALPAMGTALTLGQVATGTTLADQLLNRGGGDGGMVPGEGDYGETGAAGWEGGTPGGPGVGGPTGGSSIYDQIFGDAPFSGKEWLDLAGAGLGMYGQNRSTQSAKDQLQTQIDSDQWRPQQGRYFDPLYQTVSGGIGGTPYGEQIARESLRRSAAGGYNQSGNMLTDLAKTLDSGTNERIRALQPLAMGHGQAQMNSALQSQIAGDPLAQARNIGNIGGIVFGGNKGGGQQPPWQTPGYGSLA